MPPPSVPPASIPLIHVTDLYHPPQDPDDQLDLATILALPEYDLRAVIIDQTERFLRGAPEGGDLPRDPGLVTVAQASALIGRAIPCALGPREPLRSPKDDASDRPQVEQAGIALLLSVLASSDEPVVVSMVGSARVMTAAYHRRPELVRSKVRAVLLNAGSTGGPKKEWNVMLDPAAFQGLWDSGLPIHWFPCATEKGAFDQIPERGTHWQGTHEDLFRDLTQAWRGWFAYGLSGSARGDILRAMTEMGQGAVWEHVLAGHRSMWSTASLVMATGRVLAKTDSGWRFVPDEEATAQGLEVWPWRLDPISAVVDAAGVVQWELRNAPSSYHLFGRQSGKEYGKAMTEALGALFGTL